MLDAGTGARALGNELIKRPFSGSNLNPLSSDEQTKRDLHLFFTHYHWDHLQGFPFFGPGFVPGDNKVTIHFYGKKDARVRLSHLLAGQQQYPNSPVVWDDMPCNKYFHELPRLESVTARIGNAMITYQELTHPDSVFAYAIEAGGKKFVCATDTEHKSIADPRLVKLAKDADILYYDAQYLPEEYAGGKKGLVTGALPKLDWGHSTYQWAVINALEAGVGTVVLGHHDPLRDDSGIEEIVSRAQGFLNVQLLLPQNKWKHLDVVAAYEGLEQEL